MRSLIPLCTLLLLACNGDGDDGTNTPADPCDESGNICTWLGMPTDAKGSSEEGLDRLETYLNLPQDIEFADDGTAYYPDFNSHRVRRVNLDGTVETMSGTLMLGDGPNDQGSAASCWDGCPSLTSAWNHPTHVMPNPNAPNEIWVAAWHNSRINIIDTDAETMSWYVGTGGRQYADGPLDQAVLDLPSSVAFGDDGSVYFSDQANHLIRRITPGGELEDVAGTPRSPGYSGDGGDALAAQLHGHVSQSADPGSKLIVEGDMLYAADTVNGVIRVIDLVAGTIDTFAGKYESAGVDATGADAGSVPGYSGDGGPATEAVFSTPRDVAMGPDGEVYIADTKNHCVRVVDTSGIVETFAGVCGTAGFEGDEGPATEALLNQPFGVAVDPDGNVYITDTYNNAVRRVTR